MQKELFPTCFWGTSHIYIKGNEAQRPTLLSYHLSALKYKLVPWPKDDKLSQCLLRVQNTSLLHLPNLSACRQAVFINKYRYQTINRCLFNIQFQAVIFLSAAARHSICQVIASSTAPFQLYLMHRDLYCGGYKIGSGAGLFYICFGVTCDLQNVKHECFCVPSHLCQKIVQTLVPYAWSSSFLQGCVWLQKCTGM